MSRQPTPVARFKHWASSGGGYHLLLLFLFGMLLVRPAANLDGNPTVSGTLVYAAVFAAALFAVAGQRKILILGAILITPTLVLSVFEVSGRWSQSVVGQGFALAFLALMTVTFLRRIFSHAQVTTATLSAAACVYLFLGIAWSFAYQMVATLDPGAFSGVGESGEDLFYFSFVTLTTLGFGDIAPVSRMARSLVVVESVVGQLYLVITVARLVTLYGAGVVTGSGPRRGSDRS